MRVGNVSLTIPEGRERDSGHVELQHNTQYTLKLGNHYYNRRVDAKVVIDGKDMGTYRVNDGSMMTLECSSSDKGRFTFLVASSEMAQEAGVDKVDSVERGLVQVTFKAEKKRSSGGVRGQSASAPHDLYKHTRGEIKGIASEHWQNASPRSLSHDSQTEKLERAASTNFADAEQTCGRLEAGITGLTGSSNQTFIEVANLEYDPQEETVISLRLVRAVARVREMTPSPKANRVPSAVE